MDTSVIRQKFKFLNLHDDRKRRDKRVMCPSATQTGVSLTVVRGVLNCRVGCNVQKQSRVVDISAVRQ